ncbi:hypothetical protein SISSUDRAFT_1049392 [Sistotremastrum suecicum HHB10207 ss-3]|uniref:Uncharacterized protein n=1 Tax=Sistotremastrum suecicum HHB10207 ss-3 TaxID=1314776 RepID=A0A166BUK7_9AGAM|nr:hypothetical protein SISSUDRAFT_1049392 [Sistotremastrum suecicum HHB10207 ss-3]
MPQRGARRGRGRGRREGPRRQKQRTEDQSIEAALGKSYCRFKKATGVKLGLMYGVEGTVTQNTIDKTTAWLTTNSQYFKEKWKTADTETGAAEMADTLYWIDQGRSEAQSQDVSKLKKTTANNFGRGPNVEGGWEPALNLNSKTSWGFHHDQIARLLLPLRTPDRLDWDDESVRKEFQTVGVKLAADDLHYFLWEGNEPKEDPRRLFDGFLKGEILIKAYFILIDGDFCYIRQANGKPAKMYVTIELIVYLAMLCRYVLSSETQIDAEGVDCAGFYESLLSYLKNSAPRAFREDLIKWWNEQIGSADFDNSDDEGPQSNIADLFSLATYSTSSASASSAPTSSDPQQSSSPAPASSAALPSNAAAPASNANANSNAHAAATTNINAQIGTPISHSQTLPPTQDNQITNAPTGNSSQMSTEPSTVNQNSSSHERSSPNQEPDNMDQDSELPRPPRTTHVTNNRIDSDGELTPQPSDNEEPPQKKSCTELIQSSRGRGRGRGRGRRRGRKS